MSTFFDDDRHSGPGGEKGPITQVFRFDPCTLGQVLRGLTALRERVESDPSFDPCKQEEESSLGTAEFGSFERAIAAERNEELERATKERYAQMRASGNPVLRELAEISEETRSAFLEAGRIIRSEPFDRTGYAAGLREMTSRIEQDGELRTPVLRLVGRLASASRLARGQGDIILADQLADIGDHLDRYLSGDGAF